MNYVRNTFFSLALLFFAVPAVYASLDVNGGVTPTSTPDAKTVAAVNAGGEADGWGAWAKAAPSKAWKKAVEYKKTSFVLGGTALVAVTTGAIYRLVPGAKAKMDNAAKTCKEWLSNKWEAYKNSRPAQVGSAVGALAVAGLILKRDKVGQGLNWAADNTYRRWFAPKATE